MFKHSIRFLKRQKGYLLINIAGLSVGIASSLIIALFVNHELNYDRYNVKKDRIYRLIVNGGGYQDVGELHFHLVSGEIPPR